MGHQSSRQIVLGGIPITRIETIANRVIDRNHMGYADIYNGDKYSSYFLRDGDILMSHINSIQHLGKAAIYHPLDEKEKIIHGMNLLVLRANQKILDNQFAYFYFSSDSFLHKLPRITKKSVNQASFTVSELKKIDIPCPALSQQHKIAKILSIIQTLCNKRNEQLKILDELVKSRLFSAVIQVEVA
ncbi:restriction endonuclease subunit S [Dialister succinatiphilus]|uniref:restriction endonuclease subunit S n=1 Tax=Dialister succinatiphilus TaxID=487173 RepID=UPI003F80B769